MRSPARILLVLEVIRTAWEKSPDLRLGQLILNTRMREVSSQEAIEELYNREDDEMIDDFLRLYGN